MELFIMRHTTAADPHGFAQDADRPLTDLGRREAQTVAGAMRILGYRPEMILTSPYRRARETAAIIASGLTLEPPMDAGFLLPGADSAALLADLSNRRAESIMLVGHAPDLPQLVGLLSCGEESVALEMTKGSLAHLQADRPLRRRRAILRALLPLRVTSLID